MHGAILRIRGRRGGRRGSEHLELLNLSNNVAVKPYSSSSLFHSHLPL